MAKCGNFTRVYAGNVFTLSLTQQNNLLYTFSDQHHPLTMSNSPRNVKNPYFWKNFKLFLHSFTLCLSLLLGLVAILIILPHLVIIMVGLAKILFPKFMHSHSYGGKAFEGKKPADAPLPWYKKG